MTTDRHILDIQNLTVEFRNGKSRRIRAVSDVSLRIRKGETLGLVGESGCGKTSLARAVMQLSAPWSGRICFSGTDLGSLRPRELRKLRPGFQMIFQDSLSALNPRRKIGESISAPLRLAGCRDKKERKRLALEMMVSAGLDPELYDCRPFQLSGGQCQRVQIGRSLITRPELLICDEPVSSLDVSVQAQILNLLEKMRVEYGLTMVFISHDLAVVRAVCDRVAVMCQGQICEIAPSEQLYHSPTHPYTKELLNAIP